MVLSEEMKELQSQIMNVKVFDVYSKNGEPVQNSPKMSFTDLFELSVQDQEHTVFSFKQNQSGQLSYLSIRVSSIGEQTGEFKVINIQDQSVSILYNISEGKKKIL